MILNSIAVIEKQTESNRTRTLESVTFVSQHHHRIFRTYTTLNCTFFFFAKFWQKDNVINKAATEFLQTVTVVHLIILHLWFDTLLVKKSYLFKNKYYQIRSSLNQYNTTTTNLHILLSTIRPDKTTLKRHSAD